MTYHWSDTKPYYDDDDDDDDEGIMPGFNNSSESKITGCDPVADACRLVADRTRIEHTEDDGRCQRYEFDWA